MELIEIEGVLKTQGAGANHSNLAKARASTDAAVAGHQRAASNTAPSRFSEALRRRGGFSVENEHGPEPKFVTQLISELSSAKVGSVLAREGEFSPLEEPPGIGQSGVGTPEGANLAAECPALAPHTELLSEERAEELAERSELATELGVLPRTDPLWRSLSRFPVESNPSVSLAQRLDIRLVELVQRFAFGRQGATATLRIELGGKLRGGVLLLEGAGHGVRVQLELPCGESAAEWRAKLQQRFAEREIQLDALEVS